MAEAAINMEGYTVSEACIACDACCNDFPDVFKMNGDHTRAIAFAETPKGKFDPWDVIYVCPVDAISLIKGELPPPPADKKPASHKEAAIVVPPSEDKRPWQVRWEEAKKLGTESYWERMKRYGLASTIEETPQQYLIRLALPEKVPNHPFKFQWNLPDKMPDYKVDVKLTQEGKTLMLKGWLEDPQVKRLCGVAQSFPDRFLREMSLPKAAKDFKVNYNSKDKVLDLVIDKA